MCFQTGYIGDKKPKPLVAKKDIICYKKVLYNGRPYVKSYNMVDKKGNILTYVPGYHYYETNKTKFTYWRSRPCCSGEWFIEKGFHSVKKYKEGFYVQCNSYIVQCRIPKGALYYENKMEYVSSEIIIDKILNK